MGSEQSSPQEITQMRRSRYRTLDHPVLQNKSRVNSSKIESSRNNASFTLGGAPSIYQSPYKNYEQTKFINDEDLLELKKVGENSRSIDYTESQGNRRSKDDNDRILQQLSRKNEQLRKQLKQISDDLTQKLKRKKMVPKKKQQINDQQTNDQSLTEAEKQALSKQQMGLKRQLENGYKQIQMYKKTIINYKNKQEGETAEYRLKILQNDVIIKDGEIEKLMRKIAGIKNIKNEQDVQIQKDFNTQSKQGIDIYKRESQQLKMKLKQIALRDRQRQAKYKKQQAYQCDLEKKVRELNGSYFPQLNNHLKKQTKKTEASQKQKQKQVNAFDFNKVAEEARQLRSKHSEYNRKIQAHLQAKNKRLQEQNDLKQQVAYKERIIQALKVKIQNINTLLRPRRNNIFGSDNQTINSHENSFAQNQSQIQRQLYEQLNQDQFDIKHLIANVPKPIRKKPQQISNGKSDDGSVDGNNKKYGGGMIFTSEKAQPKKWGTNTSRVQERGKRLRGEIMFEDRVQFDGDIQPYIVGINVWVNKNNTILGIQAIYLNNNELRYGCKSSDSAEGIIRRFDLQAPDYLKNLTLSLNKDGFMESLTLYSKQGKVGKFGNKRANEQNVNYGIASNERPFLLMGATTLYESEPRLNMIGLQICSQ